MAALIANNSILEVKFFCRLSGQTSVNIRHYFVQAVGGGSITDLSAAGEISITAAAVYKPVIANEATYYGCSVQIIKPIALVSQGSRNATGVGTGGATAMPPSVSGLIKFGTAFAGRKGRGRIYVPFPAEELNGAGGTPTAGYLVSLLALGNYMAAGQVITVLPGNVTLIPAIYNRPTGAVSTIQTVTIREQWAQQRRRSLLTKGDAVPF